MKPAWILRAAFYLFAVVMLIAMIETLIGVTACAWMAVVQQRGGLCPDMAANVREIMTELIAGIMALLVASRPGGPPDQ